MLERWCSSLPSWVEYDELKKEFYSTRAYFDNAHDNMTDVWQFDRVKGEARQGHPTPKPIKMIERIVKTSSKEGTLVADPFGGSGPTLMACQTLGRTCYTMEISEKWVDVIIRRWQDFTGKQATLESNGKTFNELAEQRVEE